MYILLILSLTLTSLNSWAYPQFISHGYNACLTCHYNPHGNGPLNAYGRGLSATAISDRILHNDEKSEQELSDNSGFMYMKDFHEKIKPSLDYRGLYLDRDVDKNDGESEFINMQADLNIVYLFDKEAKLFTSISYGYAPKPKSVAKEDIETYRSREHYIGYRPKKEIGFYLGMLDKVYGIRTPDHIAFSRQTTGLAQNDQTHGLVIHYNDDLFDLGVHTFIGNLDQDEALRQKGASIKLESNNNSKFKPGISALNSRSDFFASQLMSIHFKAAYSKGSSTLFEFGKQQKENIASLEVEKSTFLFLQNYLYLRRGTYFFTTAEYYRPNDELDTEIARIGPGFQYFLNQGVEFRFDLYNTKSFNPSAATKDTYDFTGQVHLWF